MKQCFLFLSILLVMVVSIGGAADEVEIKAGINADKIGIDDVLIYTITLKGINNPAQPTLSGLKDFNVVQTSRSTEFRFVNGVSSYYTNFVYYLTPERTGTLTIPGMTYEFEGEQYRTEAFQVEVIQGSVGPSQPRRRPRFPSVFDRDDDWFRSPLRRTQPQEIDIKLKAEVSGRNAVKGEPVIYRVLLYARNRIQSVNMVSNQSFPGFWQEWFPVPRTIESQQEQVEDKIYNVYEIRKAVLFPTRAGTVTIPSLKFEMAVVDDSFSLFADTRRIHRTTPEITLQVSEPPAQAQGLPVGDFSFQVKPERKRVDINDILTLRLTISARKGNIKTLEIPQFNTTEYYKVYPAKISRNSSFDGDNLTGVLEAEIPVSFKKTGLVSFPALVFKYFNPDASIVVTLKSSPFSINVGGVKEKQESAVTIPQTEIIKKGEDIDFIKKGGIYDQERHFYKTGAFGILLVIFFVLNALYLLKIFVYDRFISQNTLLKKKRLLNKTINRLRAVQAHGEISPILEEYLQEKAGLGLSEINNHSIEALFGKHRVNDRDIEIFIRIKSDSELSRFAPQTGKDKAYQKEEDKTLKHDVKQLIEILKRIDGRIK